MFKAGKENKNHLLRKKLLRTSLQASPNRFIS